MSNELLDFEILGGEMFSTVAINLKANQQVLAEAGSMAFMDGKIDMSTSTGGGVWKGLKRSFSGESFWQNTFTGPGILTLANGLPGDTESFNVAANEGWVLTRDAYLGGTTNIEVSTKWGGFKTMFTGEGALLTHVKSTGGPGLFFAGCYGALKKHEIPEGEEFAVDNGLFFACPEGTKFKMSKIGGWKSFFLGGEGIVLRFFGPAIVYTQSRSLDPLVRRVGKKFSKS
jgi:uncharacterized protein (TIGR00266 family)